MEPITRKLMLYFPKCECEKPIIYHLVKDYGLVVNVFRAKVTPEEEGYLVLDVSGTEQEIEAGIEFIKTFNVTVNRSGKGVTRDEEHCCHCGYCVAYCPTGSLSLGDERTREVVYDETKCIECLACVRVCPYGACTAVF
jgi:ferredoxin